MVDNELTKVLGYDPNILNIQELERYRMGYNVDLTKEPLKTAISILERED